MRCPCCKADDAVMARVVLRLETPLAFFYINGQGLSED